MSAKRRTANPSKQRGAFSKNNSPRTKMDKPGRLLRRVARVWNSAIHLVCTGKKSGQTNEALSATLVYALQLKHRLQLTIVHCNSCCNNPFDTFAMQLALPSLKQSSIVPTTEEEEK